MKRIRTSSKRKSLVGKQFRSVVADGNPLWEVKRAHGRGVYLCEVVNEPVEIDGRKFDSDFAGQQGYFATAKIEAAIRWHEAQEALWKAHEDFYDNLELGSIVHYHNGFGNYVRCEVVEATTLKEGDHPCVKAGERCLKELELVGTWREWDLKADSYHASGVLQGRLFKPNASCVWESPEYRRRNGEDDPRNLPALMITGQQELWA